MGNFIVLFSRWEIKLMLSLKWINFNSHLFTAILNLILILHVIRSDNRIEWMLQRYFHLKPLILILISIQFLFSVRRLLNTLKICNWIIHLDDATKTFKAISKALKSSTISHIKIDGISVLDRNKKHRVEPQFLQTLLSSVPMLRWISVSLSGVSEEQMSFIGNSIGDIKSNEIDIRWVVCF